MKNATRTRLVKIGNSRGIRIPKALIEQLALGPEVELVVEEDHLEIHPGRKARAGWEEAFREMAERGDDKLLDDVSTTTWDESEWEW